MVTRANKMIKHCVPSKNKKKIRDHISLVFANVNRKNKKNVLKLNNLECREVDIVFLSLYLIKNMLIVIKGWM